MYMLDTNMVSQLIRRHPSVVKKIAQTPMHKLCISAIVGGELWYGVSKKPLAQALYRAVTEFLRRVDVLPWDEAVMKRYGELRSSLQKTGITLGGMDMLIAAHALHTRSVLVTNDAAFSRVDGLVVEDWTQAMD